MLLPLSLHPTDKLEDRFISSCCYWSRLFFLNSMHEYMVFINPLIPHIVLRAKYPINTKYDGYWNGKRFFWVSDPCGSPPPQPSIFPIIPFGSTTLLTRMTGISLHMQWPLTTRGVVKFYSAGVVTHDRRIGSRFFYTKNFKSNFFNNFPENRKLKMSKFLYRAISRNSAKLFESWPFKIFKRGPIFFLFVEKNQLKFMGAVFHRSSYCIPVL
jgi:hypothetical protein